MRKMLLRLSALVTVVGVSLLTVVILQGGLGKFSLPNLNLGSGAKSTTAKAPDAKAKVKGKETEDPFGPDEFNPDEQKTAAAKSPAKTQTGATNPGASSESLTDPDADEFNTNPRTTPRGLSFKAESEDAPTQLTAVDDVTSSGDPTETSEVVAETTSGKRGASSLTNDEDDPFDKHKQAAAAKAAATSRRAPAHQSGAGIDPANESIERQSAAGADSNPFDQEGAAESDTASTTPAVGGVPTGRNASRAKLIADGGPAAQTNQTATEETPDQQLSAATTEEVPPQAQARAKSAGKRLDITDDAAFTGDSESHLPAVKQTRPTIGDDSDGPTQRTAIRQGDAQPIPRRVIDSSESESTTEPAESSEQLTPPVAKLGSRRPNPLLDDSDEPAAASARTSRPAASSTEQQPPPAVGSSRVDLQACKLEYSIVSPK